MTKNQVMTKNDGFVSSSLKNTDRDRFNATLLLGEKNRPLVQTLYAFGAEIAQVRERISEPAPGEIRLQWWVDVLEGKRKTEAEKNPLSAQLLALVDRFDLLGVALLRLLAARRFDLYDDPMPDMNAFEGYAGETSAILYQLAAIIVNDGKDIGAAQAAGHIGVAHALIGHLRALPVTARRGQIVLPWSVFAAAGVSEAEYLGGKSSPAMRKGCAILRQKAGEHLKEASDAIALLPAHVRPVFAHVAVLKKQLKRLEKRRRRPFSPPPEQADWQKIATLAWWAMRN